MFSTVTKEALTELKAEACKKEKREPEQTTVEAKISTTIGEPCTLARPGFLCRLVSIFLQSLGMHSIVCQNPLAVEL
jgi:hypothetical protein